MSTNFFKKDRAFSYARLFFLIGTVLVLTAVGFGAYVAASMQTVSQHQTASQDFFEQHKVDILQYNNKRKQYIEAYGKPKTSVASTENKMLVDTYLSVDGTKGITIHYKMESDEKDDSVLVGYLITGERIVQAEDQIAFLKSAKGQTLSDLQKKCGMAKALSEDKDETLYEVTYMTQDEIIVLKIDKQTSKTSDVEVQKNKKQ